MLLKSSLYQRKDTFLFEGFVEEQSAFLRPFCDHHHLASRGAFGDECLGVDVAHSVIGSVENPLTADFALNFEVAKLYVELLRAHSVVLRNLSGSDRGLAGKDLVVVVDLDAHFGIGFVEVADLLVLSDEQLLLLLNLLLLGAASNRASRNEVGTWYCLVASVSSSIQRLMIFSRRTAL